MKGSFEYDAELDIFYIYNNQSGEDVAGSVGFGNVIYDVSVSGKVVGLEIDNASRVFNITPTLLEKVENANISVQVQKNMLLLAFVISVNKQVHTFSYVIPKNKVSITC